MINQIINKDCVSGMRDLPDDSIPLTLTSPPYDAMRIYGGHSFDFEAIATQLYRITMPGGIVVWVVQEQIVKGSETGTSSRQRLFFKKLGFRLHNTLVMQRHGSRFPSAVRYGSSPEYAFVLSKGKPRVVNLIRDKKNTAAGMPMRGSKRSRDGSLELYQVPSKRIGPYGFRGLVWFYQGKCYTDRVARAHPAVMFEQMAQDHILSWSRPGDLVFDPMCGAGTTLKMALLNDRRYLGMEIVDHYCKIANVRLKVARFQHRLRLDEFFASGAGEETVCGKLAVPKGEDPGHVLFVAPPRQVSSAADGCPDQEALDGSGFDNAIEIVSPPSRDGRRLNEGMFTSKRKDWETPQSLFEGLNAEFRFEIDVCATESNAKCKRFYDPAQDGLAQKWTGVCFMNPPYGVAIGSWVEKAFNSAKDGATVVCLLPARTDTSWWHRFVTRGEIRYLRGRLKFGDGVNPAPFPSAVVIFRPPRLW